MDPDLDPIPSRSQLVPWLIAVACSLAAGGVAVYFLNRENRWLREELGATRRTPVVAVTPTPSSSINGVPVRWTPAIGESAPPVATTPLPAAVATVSTVSPKSRGFSIAGRVMSDGNKPVVGAQVIGREGDGESGQFHEARSGLKGEFSIDGIAADHLSQLIVNADGFARVEQANVPLPLDAYEINLVRKSGVELIVSVATPQGEKPAEGNATLIVFREESTRGSAGSDVSYRIVSSDTRPLEKGRVLIPRLEAGTYRVGVQLDSEYAQTAPFAVSGALAKEVPLVLGLRQSLSGTVLSDPSQRPVPGALLSLVRVDRPTLLGRETPISARSDENGAFQLSDVPLGMYDLTLGAQNYTSKTISSVPVEVGAPPEPATFYLQQLQPGLVVDVVGADGTALADAPITVVSAAPGLSKRHFGQTGPDGRFRVESLAPGKYTVTAAMPGARGRQKNDVVEVKGTEDTSVHFAFKPLVAVAGKASRQGKAVKGLLSFRIRGQIQGEQFVKAGDGGEFCADLEPGEYSVTAPLVPGAAQVLIPSTDRTEVEVKWPEKQPN